MADEKQSNRVIAEGGLDSSKNYINLSTNKPGSAIRLVNYEVGLAGGYRKVNGYKLYDAAFGEVGVGGVGQGKILGLMMFENSVTNATEIYAARRSVGSPTQYNLYRYSAGSGWLVVVTGLTHNYNAGGTTVDKLRWDQGSDGTINYLVFVDGVNNATIFDGTTWTFIDIAGTGANFANAGGANALDAPTLVSFFENHLFIGGDIRNNVRGVLSYSAPNAYYNWTTASGAGQVVAGTLLVNFKPFRENLYVFGSNAIKRVFFDTSLTTPAFLIKDVTVNLGLINPDVVFELGGSLIFLSQDGFRPLAGTDKIGDVQLETISKAIHTLIRTRLIDSAGVNMNAVVIRGKSQFRVFFGDGGTIAANSRGIIGGLRTPDQQTGWEFGELLGFRTSVVASRYVNGVEVVLHGDFDGMVYQQESGSSLNGGVLTSVYTTPYLDLGDTEVRKVSEKITTFMDGEGDTTVTLSIAFDWGRPEVTNPAAYSLFLDADAPIYDDPLYLYDNSAVIYGGQLTPIAVQNIEGSFFSISLTYSTSGVEKPHSIHAIIIEYSPKGRR